VPPPFLSSPRQETLRTPLVLPCALAWLASLAACGERREAAPKPVVADAARVLATVNGVPITADDLDQISKRAVSGGGPDHERSGQVLQTLVHDELIYQKAVQLGLDRDPEYRQRLEVLQSQLRAFRRQEMSARFLRYVQEQAAVADPEARAYFEKNATFIQSRFHVFQILYKGRTQEILKDHQDLKNGTPFEKVAARRFPGLPPGARPPWDLGELRWFQIPRSWLGIVDRLEPRQVSGIIQGENERAWVIQLVGRRVDPAISYETEKGRIVEILRQEKAGALYDGMLTELKGKADIVYPK
jgi:hypothetical protein